MALVIILLGMFAVLEFATYLRALWKYRKYLAVATFAGILLVSTFLVINQSLLVGLLLSIITLYRLFNVYRAGFGLSSSERLRHTAFNSSLRIGLVLAFVILLSVYQPTPLDTAWLFYTSSVLLLIFTVFTWRALSLSVGRMKLPSLITTHAHRDLPSITVAIPARNETTDLEDCLKSLVASNYPKLEILILDDCSQNRRTPDIIRQFAHDGARFLSGAIPPEPWLAKNFAYEQLLKEANGEYMLFCGVDTRFEPQSILRIAEALLQSEEKMISLMPVNKVSKGNVLPYLIQPIRYAWEIALPRRWPVRPPVLSTCWVARRDFLLKSGGFAAVKQAILPERYFARQALKESKYAFFRSDPSVGLTCVKSGPQQLDTAIRTRYPILQRSPEFVMVVGLAELSIVFMPILLILYGLLNGHILLVILNVATIGLLSAIYGTIDKMTYEKWKLVSLVAMPAALIVDFAILHISMYRYEFSVVLWKGRNICLPVLETIPHLPRLDKTNPTRLYQD